MYRLEKDYGMDGMSAYSRLQEEEFDLERSEAYRASKHQKFVGTGFFDDLLTSISSGQSSVVALVGSTEEEQFN
jgi:isocitrate lyase